MSSSLSDDSPILEVKICSPMQNRWIDLQQNINSKVIGFDNWTTVVTAVLAAAPTGYVMCAQNSSTQGIPTACYLVDIYANRTAREARPVVSVVQDEIYKFLNPSSTPSSNVVFTKRFAPESVTEGTNALDDSSRIVQLERDVRILRKTLASKL